jgi:hypothetical protein
MTKSQTGNRNLSEARGGRTMMSIATSPFWARKHEGDFILALLLKIIRCKP